MTQVPKGSNPTLLPVLPIALDLHIHRCILYATDLADTDWSCDGVLILYRSCRRKASLLLRTNRLIMSSTKLYSDCDLFCKPTSLQHGALDSPIPVPKPTGDCSVLSAEVIHCIGIL